MKTRVRHLYGSLLVALLLSALGINVVQAQTIMPDTDTHTVISSPNTNPQQFDITGGTRSGGNLFHSFQQFGLSTGQIANFLSHPAIQNILGRITGGNISRIDGLIQVTGGNSNLFLMNPAGIIFGAHARLNVPAAFVATTANGIQLGNSWFNAIGSNNYANLTSNPDSFAFLGNAGAILNAGVLTANPGQQITLLGGVVVNTGTISAPGGTITIAAVPGQRLVRITQEGSLLSLLLPTETANTINSPTTSPLTLSALLAGGGLPEATGITVENGIVRLTNTGTVIPTEAGSATVSGALSTAATTSPNTSQIQVLADRISLQNATLDASGINGGVVRIGGDYQGSGTRPKARTTEMDTNSIIHADAIADIPGNGGSVVIWSTDTTQVAGTMTAQGSNYGGNGGLVETSSQGTLIVSPVTRVSTYAPQGQTGTWLLDPPELTVATDGTATIAGEPLTNTPTTATTVSATAIVTGLNGNNVNLQASDRIVVNAAIDASANPVAGDLTLTTPTTTLNQPISLATGSNLSGTATTVNVNPGARIQNGVDVAASGGTVNVAGGTFYVPGVTNQVSITKPLTVQGTGAGNTIVDGGSNSRGFYIDPGAGNTVNLDSLTIQNGYVVGDGAGILVNSGTLNLSNSILSSNSARDLDASNYYDDTYSRGGGIFNATHSIVNLLNSTVSDSSATYGGGIFNAAYGTVNVLNSTLSSNSAHWGGGISNGGVSNIYIQPYDSYGGEVNLTNSTLRNNSADEGGGIFNHYGIVNVLNSTLSGNSAIDGGAISNGGYGLNWWNSGFSRVNLQNSTLSDNSATYGGAISNSGVCYGMECDFPQIGFINLFNSTLSHNLATYGGAIYNVGEGRVTVVNSALDSNSATNGGAIHTSYNRVLHSSNYDSEYGGIYLINSSVSSNLAANGGGIYTSYGVVNLINSTLIGNLVTQSAYGNGDGNRYTYSRGGGIYTHGGTINLTNSTLSGNLAINFDSSDSDRFNSRGRRSQGGGIYNNGGTLNLTDSVISNNSANWNSPFYSYLMEDGGGGGIYNTANGTVNITNTTLSSNSAIGDFYGASGGGIYNSGIVNVNNSTISGNSVIGGFYSSGGGIYNDGTANIANSTISENSVTSRGNNNYGYGGGGGGIYNRGTVNLTNSFLSGNSAADYYYYAPGGGGIYNGGIASLTNSLIIGNSAGWGSGIYNTGGTINLTNSILDRNFALNSGGGIYNASSYNHGAYNHGMVIILNSTLSSNSAGRDGGGIVNSDSVAIFNSTLIDNSAVSGGGISSSGTVNLANSLLNHNLAVDHGGSIYNSGTVTVTNSTLSENLAIKGGAIYNSGTTTVANSTLSRNSAVTGGGIYNYGERYTYYTPGYPEMGEPPFFGPYTYIVIGKVTVSNSTFSGNLATELGGGIYNSGTAWVSSSTIANNSANSGGGVFNAASIENATPANTFAVHNSIIAGNAASSGRELTNLGSSTSEGYNLFGFNGDSGVEGIVLSATDIVPSVAMNQILTPLGDYGGLTQTHALVPGSPAIDMGDPSITTLDQRGFTRVGRADIGAVEFHAPSPSPSLSSPSSSFTLPSFNPEDLNQLSAALMGREIESMTISIQPIPTESILCVDRSPNEEESAELYQGIPDCPE
ncbi:filamentous hemagglutinin N-terminal domain-containing protein [Pantanalinema sp. GBBB05]|uniref:two-partner secretion domain-containing protein n=1 Tax=Pantanalinema sp. GBBB05 TaxID=2604139 RepID=UPI001D9852A9|nr:filamentous hemagglutinin N-terminal domain-containing protein [Pantanalinema sp. GBBB05]